MMTINFVWPLTLLPMHLLCVHWPKWRFWQYLLACAMVNLLMAFLVQRFGLGLRP